MSWFRLDDQGAFHAKVLEAGNEAYGAWCRAGQWSSAHLTEGRIPRAVALSIAPMRVWGRLVKARLLEAIGDDFQIHDFLDWNPTAEQEKAKRAARAEAGRAGGKRSAEQRASKDPSKPPPKSEANAQAIASAIAQASWEQKPTPSPSPFPNTATPPNPPSDLEAIERELRRHPVFACLDLSEKARAIEQRFRTLQIAKGMRLEWVIESIGKVAADISGVGLDPDEIGKKLTNYVDRSRAPRPERTPGHVQHDRPGSLAFEVPEEAR